MVALPGDRDSAAASGDDQIAGLHHGTDRADLDDLCRLRGSYYTAVASSCVFLHDIVEFFFHHFRLLCIHKLADGLAGILESRVIFIHTDLGDHGCNRNIRDIAVQKLFAERVLQVIADVSLAHGNAYGEGSVGLLQIFMGQCDHGIVDHADLGAVSVGYYDFTAVFDQIYDCLSGNLYCCHLLRQSISKSISAKCDDNSFLFRHHICLSICKDS